MLRPRSDPKTESSSDRVTCVLPMTWMEDADAMRKRGSSLKKLRIKIATHTSPAKTTIAPAAAEMRPTRVVGTRPRRTGTRRRARKNPSSSEPAFFFGPLSWDLVRALDEGAGRKYCSVALSSANAVTRFACESIFATPESGREICHPNYIVDF